MRRYLTVRAAVIVAVAATISVVVSSTSSASITSSVRLGVVHGQNSLNPWNPPTAVEAGRAVLSSTPGTLQTQHIMGWGATNPEPSPGVYDWRSLDRRLALIRETGGTPVITLCCAPDWMKGGRAGTTDWSRLEEAPSVSYFDEFAALAAKVARRYPDVRYFQVWNEMKGFWDSIRNRWRYEDYTKLYNLVYKALNAVNPAIEVGGPYVSMVSWPKGVGGGRNSSVSGPWGMVDQRALDVITYWLRNAIGADFIAVDGPASLRDGTFLVSPAKSAEKFAAVNTWIRSRTSLPIWWSELHPVPYGTSSAYSRSEEVSIWLAAMDAVNRSGASAAFFWQPEGSPTHTGLWTSTSAASGGRATALHQPLKPWLG